MKSESLKNGNMDFLKVILIMMILFHHYSGLNIDEQYHFILLDNIFNGADLIFTINCFFVDIFKLFGKIATNTFVLISGFFLIDYKGDIVKKTVIFFLRCVIFSIFIYFFSLLTHYDDFSLIQLILSVIAPLDKFWFLHTYFSLIILSPFLNRFLKSLNKKDYKHFLLLLLLIWCIFLTIGLSNSNFRLTNLGWFIFLYSTSAYYRLYVLKHNKSNKFYFKLFFISFFVLLFLCESKSFVEKIITFKELLNPDLLCQNNIFMFICSVSLFLCFKNSNFNDTKIMHFISSSSLSVYMLHDNTPALIFIDKIIDGNLFIKSVYFVGYSTFAVISIFVFCLIVDLLLYIIFDKIILLISDKVTFYLRNIWGTLI